MAGLALAVALMAGGTAVAQQGTGALTGTVFDNATKKPMPDVIVMVSSPALQEDQVTVTDASGFYRVPNLPPGNYKIHFEKDGYFPNEQDGIALRADVTFRLNPSLALAQGQAEEVVVKVRPTVDVGSSTTSTSMNTDFLKRVPVSAPGSKGAAARSFESVAEVAPGANADQYGTGINGASSPENHYSIDGLSVGNPGKGTVGTQLSTEFVEEVNVVQAGYMPEFGRSTGGVLNVVTKSGSNEFHGGVFSYLSPGGLEGKRKVVGESGDAGYVPVTYDPKLSYIGDIGFDIGGPIVKDKLWFYAGGDISNTKYTITRTYQRNLGTEEMAMPDPIYAEDYIADSRMYQLMGKLTYSANADNRLSVSVMATPVVSGGGGSFNPMTGVVTPGKYAIDPATGYPEAGGTGTYGSQAHEFVSMPIDFAAKWNSQFMQKRLLLDVMFGTHYQVDSRRAADGSTAGDFNPAALGSYYNVNYRRRADATDAAGNVIGRHDLTEFETFPGSEKCNQDGANCKVAEYVSGSPRDLSDARYNRYHGSVIVSYLANAVGHHLIKAGVDSELTSYKNIKSNRVFSEAEDGSQFDDEERFGILTGPDMFRYIDPLEKQTKSMVVGGFIQDSWSVLDKITLNLGFRYDAQYFYNTAGNVALSLPNQWSPRLGVIYDPTQSGKAKVFVNYARYYENAPLDFADVALSGEPQLHGGHLATDYAGPGMGCNPTDFGAQNSTGAGGCQNSANLVANSESEPRLPNRIFTAGGSPGTLDPDIQASSSDELSGGAEYELFPDARIGLSYTRRWINRWVEDMAPVLGLSGFNGNPGYGLGASFPKVERTYQAATLALTKNFSSSWLAQASYTMAFLKGNYAGLIAPEDGYLGPNATADFDSPNVEINRYGDLPGDFRHTFKVFGSKDWQLLPNQHLVTGFAARARSGGATSYLANDPNTYPTESYIVPRGTGPRMPWTYGLDLQLSYRIAMARGIAVSVTADIFNLLNLQGVVARNQEYTSSSVIATPNYKVADLNNLTNTDGQPVDVNPLFGKDAAYQEPRVFRFGVRGEF